MPVVAQRIPVQRHIRQACPRDRPSLRVAPVCRRYADRRRLVGRRGVRQRSLRLTILRACLPVSVGRQDHEIIIQVCFILARNIGQLLPGSVPVQGIVARGHFSVGRPDLFSARRIRGRIAHVDILERAAVRYAQPIPAGQRNAVPRYVDITALRIDAVSVACRLYRRRGQIVRIGSGERHTLLSGQHIRRTDSRPRAVACHRKSVISFLIRRIKPCGENLRQIHVIFARVQGNRLADIRAEAWA